MSIGQKHQSQTDMSLGQANRPWIQVRLTRPHPDVDDILAGWARQRKKSANMVAAIQLYEAVLQGNVEEVGRLMAAVGGRGGDVQDSLSLSYKESDSIKEIEEKREEAIPADIEALMQQLAITCRKDVKLNAVDLRETADKLHEAGYVAEDVKRWTAEVWPADWRGKKGDLPTFKNVINEIAKVRSLPTTSDENPYLQDAYFQRGERADELPVAMDASKETVTQLRRHHPRFDHWHSAIGHMSIAAYQAKDVLVSLLPIGFMDDDTLIVEVRGEQMRERLNKGLIHAITDQYNHIDYARSKGQRPPITIRLVLPGELTYLREDTCVPSPL